MGKITASGKLDNKQIKITAIEINNNIEVQIDGEEYTKVFYDLYMDYIPAMGGTFYPDRNTMLAVFSVLTHWFFDDNKYEIEIEGDIGTIPYEEGVIY